MSTLVISVSSKIKGLMQLCHLFFLSSATEDFINIYIYIGNKNLKILSSYKLDEDYQQEGQIDDCT